MNRHDFPVNGMTPGLLLPLLLLAGCASTPAEVACRAKGGRMVAFSMFIPTCEWPTTDTGKACTDNRDCQGLCKPPESAYRQIPILAEQGEFEGVAVESRLKTLAVKKGEAITGVCAAVQHDIRTPNCTDYVSDSKVVLAPCVD